MSTAFRPWYRGDAPAFIATPQSVAPATARGSFHTQIEFGTDRGPLTIDRGGQEVDGPGDIDVKNLEGQVIGRSPRPGDPEADHERFPHIEFRRPDLPWVYTPFGPEPDTKVLAPWLVLVVVEDREGITIGQAGRPSRDVLSVDHAARELPDLTQTHAWAHVQMSGTGVTSQTRIGDLLDTHPTRVLSRLVCPRLLAPQTSFIAALVPSFELGRRAGLGEDVTGVPNGWAWDHASDDPVLLPVYLHWRFTTARDSGFESLVRRLRARTPADLPGLGTRLMDVSDPGGGLPEGAAADVPTVEAGGAFRVPGQAARRTAAQGLRQAIAEVVEQVDQLAPPMYGRWHAAQTELEDPPAGWVSELNTEPACRVYAGECGARIVQQLQEELMAAAWNQVGALDDANALLRQGQLALHVARRIFARHIAPLDDVSLLRFAGPVLARLPGGPGNQTMYGRIAGSCLPLAALDPAFTRLTRLGGPLAKRLVMNADDIEGDFRRSYHQLASGEASLASDDSDRPPATWVHRLDGDRQWVVDRVREIADADADVFDHVAARSTARAVCTPEDVGELAKAVRNGLDPQHTVPRRYNALVDVPPELGWDPGARLEPIMAAPELPLPLYLPLALRDQDWLLPGLEHVPQNSTLGLEADNEFVECVMVGANFEMGRELLWRGYPTDQRGTVFSRFFDIREQEGERVEVRFAEPQIDHIHTWGRATSLGTHVIEGTKVGFVLLVRGDLIRRFPAPDINLVRAHWVRDEAGDQVFDPAGNPVRRPPDAPIPQAETSTPLFTGLLDPDVLFVGFPQSAEDARGHVDPDLDAGYYVMFEERATEPGLRISAPVPGDEPAEVVSWKDLHRSLVGTNTSGHLNVASTPDVPDVLADQWSARADVMAALLTARTSRLFTHVDDLVPASDA